MRIQGGGKVLDKKEKVEEQEGGLRVSIVIVSGGGGKIKNSNSYNTELKGGSIRGESRKCARPKLFQNSPGKKSLQKKIFN